MKPIIKKHKKALYVTVDIDKWKPAKKKAVKRLKKSEDLYKEFDLIRKSNKKRCVRCSMCGGCGR